MAAHPFLAWDGPLPFAHRGGASDNPENTMPAFEHAVRLGYTYLETDVHATRDGVLVAFHDPDLSRTCGIDGTIAELPWSTVSAARVDGREPIPLFDDLVAAFPEARINIDCKADAAVDALVAALRRHDCLDRVCVGAFSGRRLSRIRGAIGDRLCTSAGPLAVAGWRLVGLRPGPALCLQIPVEQGPLRLVTERSVGRAHRLGLQVHVWTIDDPVEMTRLLDLGVDGIMTDRPQILKDVLTERGRWVD